MASDSDHDPRTAGQTTTPASLGCCRPTGRSATMPRARDEGRRRAACSHRPIRPPIHWQLLSFCVNWDTMGSGGRHVY